MRDYETTPTTPTDPDYADGIAAFKRGDWHSVIDSLTRVVAQRPWHDNAYSLLGYASRKLGHYQQALGYYQQALELNPHHRGALEYLGEAYVEMGCTAQAHTVLTRLQAACIQLRGTAWQSTCTEWQQLKAVIDAAPVPARMECPSQASN
jgi:tetratricopeptide (TPR) repeat protein